MQETVAHQNLTNRRDAWWFLPLLMLVTGIVMVCYMTWAAWVNESYAYGPYLSPLYATPWVPEWWTISPAFLLLWIPAGFRITCYYGRKVYHRAVFGSPMACAVEQPHKKGYGGESKWPMIMNNLHRYFLFFALVLAVLHWWDFFHALRFEGNWYLGVGTLILFIDTLALTFYVGGCHSLRHFVGGRKRCLTACKGCSFGVYKRVSALNAFHNVWFWVSLFSIAAADLYIRLLAMGVIPNDPHLIF